MKKVIIAESLSGSIQKSHSLFGRGGFKTFLARTSEDILKLHGDHKADLIITEFSLPGMDGARLCSTIRSDDALKEVSIIMICGDDQASMVPCGEAGANALIVPPVDPVTLYARISELLIVPQRKDIRALLRVSVSDHGGGPTFFATSQNVSISGMLLETNTALKKGARLTCSFFIGHSEIVAECEVMRVHKNPGGRFQNGVKFINMETKFLILIDQFVKNRIRH